MSHQIMSLFGAAQATYYPEPGAGTSSYYGCNNSAASLFTAGHNGTIRSILISNTITNPVTVTIYNTAGNRVDEWVTGPDYAQNILLGPDGIFISGGFYVTVSVNDGAYITIIYDGR